MKKGLKDKITIFIILLIILVLGIIYIPKMSNYSVNKENNQMTQVKLTTNQGEIIIELYDDMPITTGNFISLVEKGVYNGVIFHRVIDGFMIQGGDPTGTGYGDPSIPNIEDEFTHAGGNKNNKYTISMANAGPNTGSSQFFINVEDNNFLDSKHPAFGEVIDGTEVVDVIAEVETGANDRPVEDVVIEKASII
ncbi:MAG: peptidylprolyl isomerase [Candidatus Pacearchaeota archaeon]|jgi:peptidylprolyl isomerase